MDLERRIALLENKKQADGQKADLEVVVEIQKNLQKAIEQQGTDLRNQIAALEHKVKEGKVKKEVEKMETAVNEWIKKVEVQLTVLSLALNSVTLDNTGTTQSESERREAAKRARL